MGTAGHRPPAAPGQAGSEESPDDEQGVGAGPPLPPAPRRRLHKIAAAPWRYRVGFTHFPRLGAKGRPAGTEPGPDVSRGAARSHAGRDDREDRRGTNPRRGRPARPEPVEDAIPNPTKSRPHSPLAGVRRAHLLLLRRHDRRHCASPGPRLQAG